MQGGAGAFEGLVLAVDTTGERCSACLVDASSLAVIASRDPLIGKGHAERLVETMAETLAEANRTYDDLGRIAVAVGPGSFTGIRVGVSVARGLALALSVPAVGVDVLEALAFPHLNQELAVLVVQDARRGEVYAALYDPDGTALRPPSALAPDALAAFAALREETAIVLVGSGAPIAASRLPGARVASTSGEAAIGSVGRIAARREPGAAIRPLYLRQADAKPSSSRSLVGAT